MKMIGKWENEGCVFGLLPKCLQNGDNPGPISGSSFPLYNGPSAGGKITGNLINNCAYNFGEVSFDGSGDYIQTNYKNPLLYSITVIIRFNCTLPGNTGAENGSGAFIDISDTSSSKRRMYIGVQGRKISATIYREEGDLGLYVTGDIPVPTFKHDYPFKFNDGTDRAIAVTFSPENQIKMFYDFEGSLHQAIDESYDLREGSNTTLPHIKAADNSENMKLRIGAISYDGNIIKQYQGTISQLLFYDRELSQLELNQVYNLGPDLGGLKLYDKNNGTGDFFVIPEDDYNPDKIEAPYTETSSSNTIINLETGYNTGTILGEVQSYVI